MSPNHSSKYNSLPPGLSGMFRSKDSSSKDSISNLKNANSVASINSLSDSGLASVGGGPPGSVTNEKANIVT